jgi:hypothetical protein
MRVHEIRTILGNVAAVSEPAIRRFVPFRRALRASKRSLTMAQHSHAGTSMKTRYWYRVMSLTRKPCVHGLGLWNALSPQAGVVLMKETMWKNRPKNKSSIALTNFGSRQESRMAGTRSSIIRPNKSCGTRINPPHCALPTTSNCSCASMQRANEGSPAKWK